MSTSFPSRPRRVTLPDHTAAPTSPRVSTPELAASRTARQVRSLFVVMLLAAMVVGFVSTSPSASAQAVSAAGEDLTRLLRGMAALKVLLALGAVLGVFWRLGAPVSAPRFMVYALACGAMALGPGLIWGMVHVRSGALLLHGGLLISLVVLWRDPAVGRRLAERLALRRTTSERAHRSR